MRTGRLTVSGITCAGWAKELQSALKSMRGVNDVRVSLGTGETEVVFDEKQTTLDELKVAIMQQGFFFCTPTYSVTH
ncbi:MAG TPA: heavy-metal-associated domain-containing protein [Methylophilaceae bacterium]|nr:heavy-metal-associated domain-containing protein [Methylophilaceae bacterium]